MLHRLQAQTLSYTTSPIGKVKPSQKIAVTFELVIMQLWYTNIIPIYSVYDWKHQHKPFGLGGAVQLWKDKG